MKIQWSAFFSSLLLFTLVGCGSEQFGTTPQSSTSAPNAVVAYQQLSCSSHTLVKPKVDIVYFVDNSGSSFYIADNIKEAIRTTVNTVSQQFDYRIIGTQLVPTANPNSDYQVLTNSVDPLPVPGNKIVSASQLDFFNVNSAAGQTEKGLKRVLDFVNGTNGLIRPSAHLLVVLVSNGRDLEVELDPNGDGQTVQNGSLFSQRLNSFNMIKSNPNLMHFFAVTAKTQNCKPEWRRSTHSYIAMAQSVLNGVHYDLCTQSVSDIFANVNNSIQQEIIPHQYRFFPMTFAKDTDTRNSFGEIEVFKVSGNNPPVKLTSGWSYHLSTQGYEDTKVAPAPAGERVYGKHFIKFDNVVTYPDCIQIKSVSKTEYFKYIVVPREPRTANPPITVFINGRQLNSSEWAYRGNINVPNIKAAYPQSGDELPAVPKSGYMIELLGPSSYYKSGDNVQVNYVPAGV